MNKDEDVENVVRKGMDTLKAELDSENITYTWKN
jgi:hypothetical protein